MNPYTFPNNPTPPRGGDYTDGTHYYRVTVTEPVTMAQQPGCKQVWSRGWVMDSNGVPVPDANGNPIHTEQTPHTVILSQIQSKQATVNPGWIVYQLSQANPSTPDPSNLPAGWTSGTSLPATGSVGDYFYNSSDGSFWQWSDGLLHDIHKGHLTQLASLIASNGVTF